MGCDPSSGLTLPDISAISTAYDLRASRICNHAYLRAIIRRVLDAEGPVVCEVMISPEQYTAPKVSSTQRPDGSMVSNPLEDMWTFLEPEEIKENMAMESV